MKYMWKQVAVVVLAVAAFFGVFFGVAYKIGEVKCRERWRDSGMKSRFTLWTHCQIQTKPGVWIPADRYREIE